MSRLETVCYNNCHLNFYDWHSLLKFIWYLPVSFTGACCAWMTWTLHLVNDFRTILIQYKQNTCNSAFKINNDKEGVFCMVVRRMTWVFSCKSCVTVRICLAQSFLNSAWFSLTITLKVHLFWKSTIHIKILFILFEGVGEKSPEWCMINY